MSYTPKEEVLIALRNYLDDGNPTDREIELIEELQTCITPSGE